jgi:two-component system response regulator MprA
MTGALSGDSMPTILIADADPQALALLQETLLRAGYSVLTAADGPLALSLAVAHQPDLVVLDWSLPPLSGLDVVQRLRASVALPILMLTARDSIGDRVAGLDGGADDYVIKPFVPAELLARIRALLRRRTPGREKPLRYADLLLNPLTYEVWRGERLLRLSLREYELLFHLLRHPRQVLSRSSILQEVWGYDFEGADNVVDVYIGYLRTKMEAAGEPRLIQTVRGVGYVLRADETGDASGPAQPVR